MIPKDKRTSKVFLKVGDDIWIWDSQSCLQILLQRRAALVYDEAFPNALKNRYWGKSSFCYYLPADKFTDATGDPCEVVSEESVDIIGFEEIKDIGLEFEKLEKEGKIKFVWYNESPENSKEVCDKRALQLLIDRGFFEGKEFRQREWASKYYKDIIEDYLKEK